MSDELKSAWEVALEKLEARGEGEIESLSGEQKQAISEVRRKYKARMAEAEISTAGRIKEALESGEVDKLQSLQEELARQRKRLEEQMEAKVEEIREAT